jgi:hypothetical protein
MISTETAETIAKIRLGCGPKIAQAMNATIATTTTAGTK